MYIKNIQLKNSIKDETKRLDCFFNGQKEGLFIV